MATQCGNFRNFSVTQILREMSSKTGFYAIPGSMNFGNLVKFLLSESAKIPKNQNSEHLNVLKWQIVHSRNLKI